MAGASAFHLMKLREQKTRELAASLAAKDAANVEEQLALFRKHVEEFASKHRRDINGDPEFRRAFTRMAKAIGVDLLASSKGIFTELLGLGDYYFELAVQIVDACLEARAVNGGLMPLAEVRARVQRMRPRGSAAISDDDVKQALKKLEELGGGYRVVKVGAARFVLSVPAELSSDTVTLLQRCADGGGGFVTEGGLARDLGWARDRAAAACARLVHDGFAWVDDGAPRDGRRYYFPALWAGGGAGGGTPSSAASVASR